MARLCTLKPPHNSYPLENHVEVIENVFGDICSQCAKFLRDYLQLAYSFSNSSIGGIRSNLADGFHRSTVVSEQNFIAIASSWTIP